MINFEWIGSFCTILIKQNHKLFLKILNIFLNIMNARKLVEAVDYILSLLDGVPVLF